jgi:predicted nicotinamide N-methyase
MEYLLDHPDLVKDKYIIELGAGTGVLGMLCKCLGADNVQLTDHDERSLTHMRRDIQDNNITASVTKLDWFNPDLSFLENTKADISNIRIVAGDVLYKECLIIPFLSLTKQLLLHKSSFLLLCHIPRAGVEQQQVQDACKSFGLEVEIIHEDLWKKGACIEYSPSDDYNRATLYCIRNSM